MLQRPHRTYQPVLGEQHLEGVATPWIFVDTNHPDQDQPSPRFDSTGQIVPRQLSLTAAVL